MPDSWETLKLLSDPTRLRILNLLYQEELSVAELQEILNMGQSRISTHLSLLRNGKLVTDRKDGKRTYYSHNTKTPKNVDKLINAARGTVNSSGEVENDHAQLTRILSKRREISEKYFNSVAGRLGKNYCPGRSWEAIGHLLLKLTPQIDIVDLGAGEGALSLLLARRAKSVYCIDNSIKMVEVGERLAQEHGFDNLQYKLGDIEKVPLKDKSADLVLLSQALHHAQKPEKAIKEAVRLLRPKGQILIIDLHQHNFEQARELYADLWLGFSENQMYKYLKDAELESVEVSIVTKEEIEPYFETILASGIKP